MRIAIVADIHGNLPALEAVVRDFSRRGVDAVVNLGDSLSGPLLPLETARFLMAQDWVHIAGNHERQLIAQGSGRRGASDEFAHSHLTSKELEWLASLKPSAQYCPEVLLCHGTPTSDVDYFLETVEPTRIRAATLLEVDARLGKVEADLIACGHTHIPRSVRASTGQLIINPGSVGLPAYDDIHPYPHVIETGSPDARYAIVERLANLWVATLISVSYPYSAMANLARTRQRQDWARALSSGYMS
ncbi:MAG: metallophosphoesterase family protein [Deltaproteobacteria bacterium]|nr:metallophosphoesterase family protein [Deltaproteobacteria bacterium]